MNTKKPIKYYLLQQTGYAYPIFSTTIICEFCKKNFTLEYESNLEKITKKCPFCKQEMDIKLK